MAENKVYKITNPETKETFTVSLDHEPTDEELDNISSLRSKNKVQQESSLKQAGLSVKAPQSNSNFLGTPYPWEGAVNNLGNKLNSYASKVSPYVESAGAGLMGGIAPGFVLPFVGKDVGEKGYNLVTHPSVDNLSELAKSLGYAIMAGYSGPSRSAPSSSPRQIETGPIQGPGTNPTQLNAENPIIDVKAPAQIPARTEAGNPTRGQGFTVNAPKVIRPTTEGVYEVPEVKPLEGRSEELSYGKHEGAPLKVNKTGFKTKKSSGSVVENDKPRTEGETKGATGDKPNEKMPEKIDKKGEENAFDQSSMGDFISNVKIPDDISEEEFNKLVEWGIHPEKVKNIQENISNVTEQKPPTKYRSSDKALDKMKESGEKYYTSNENYDPKTGQPKYGAQKIVQHTIPIKNEWLRSVDDSVLKQMYPGSSGDLKSEIETVMQEKGIGPKVAESVSKKLKEELEKSK